MNKKIEELAEQCGFRSNPDIYDRNQSFDIEKFAELIVKECVAVLIHHHPYTTDPEAYHYAISLIEEHFGIEE
jgi:hypothetical protein